MKISKMIGVETLIWIKSVPGGFVTSNSKIAALKLWNVSNKYENWII